MIYLYRLILIYVLIHCYILNSNILEAKIVLSDKQLDFQANNVDYNFKENFLVATGNVEFKSENRVLKADIIYYDTKENVMFAEGNVYYKDKDGNVLYPKSIEIDSQLKNGKLNILNSELKDKSILFAKLAEKSNENQYHIKNMCYTSCHLIDSLTPLWQIKSNSGTYDTQADKVIMYNAWIEIKDVPILWTPYLSFSNFKKIREAGFLYPRISIDKILGLEFEIPFYIPLGDYQEIIIDNHFYRNVDINQYLPVIQYDANIYDGSISINTSFYPESWDSITKDSLKNNDDWHFFLKLNKELNDVWRSSVQISQTSNIKYLNLHNINPKDTAEKYLNNNITNEFFINQNNYLEFNLFTPIDIYERDLRSSNIAKNQNLYNNEIELRYMNLQDYSNFGSFNITTAYNTFFKSTSTSFSKDSNDNITRLAIMFDYNYLNITQLGNYSAQITYDNTFYIASSQFKENINNQDGNFDNYFSYYTIGLTYEYPITSIVNNSVFTIAPITSVSIHSVLDKNKNNFLLDDNNQNITPHNIFESANYNNFDYIDNINSLSYGIKMYGNINSAYASFFAGQKINDIKEKSYILVNNIQTEVVNSSSNYFISFSIAPIENINVNYETILLPNFKTQKNITEIDIISSIFSFNTRYTSTLTNQDTNLYLEQISFNGTLNLNQTLSIGLLSIYNIENKNTFNLNSVQSTLTWFNDCIYLQGYISRSYYLNDAQNSYGIRIIIKGVGGSDLKIL